MRECVVSLGLCLEYYIFDIRLDISLECGSMALSQWWYVQVFVFTVSKDGWNTILLELYVLFRDKNFIWLLFLVYFASYVLMEAGIIYDVLCYILVYILMLYGWNYSVKLVAHRVGLLYVLLPLLDVVLFMFVGNH